MVDLNRGLEARRLFEESCRRAGIELCQTDFSRPLRYSHHSEVIEVLQNGPYFRKIADSEDDDDCLPTKEALVAMIYYLSLLGDKAFGGNKTFANQIVILLVSTILYEVYEYEHVKSQDLQSASEYLELLLQHEGHRGAIQSDPELWKRIFSYPMLLRVTRSLSRTDNEAIDSIAELLPEAAFALLFELSFSKAFDMLFE